jgi:hypothetical protein
VARWADIEAAEPEFCVRARSRFDAHVHKTIATLRRDGSPRISGIEAIFAEGDVWVGSMRHAVKALDLQRDPRFALHSGSDDPPDWQGDARLSGTAEEILDQAVLDSVMTGASPEAHDAEHEIEQMHLFRLEIEELVWIGVDEAGERLIVESWHPGRGLQRIER